MASITLNHIVKTFDDGITVIPDLNLEIKDKEFVIFVGPSGCGARARRASSTASRTTASRVSRRSTTRRSARSARRRANSRTRRWLSASASARRRRPLMLRRRATPSSSAVPWSSASWTASSRRRWRLSARCARRSMRRTQAVQFEIHHPNH